MTRLAQRDVSHSDQMQFASVSDDHNPTHVDMLAARRTQAGAPVIHGMNPMLRAFDSLAAAVPNLPSLRSFTAQYYNFVHLEETVQADFVQHEPTCAKLTISLDNVPRAKVALEFGQPIQQ